MNLGDLYARTLLASSTALDFIIVSPQKDSEITPYTYLTDPNSQPQLWFPDTWKFQVVQDETVNLQSDITDHYVEDNTAMQDHITLRPAQVTVSGLVSELTDEVPRYAEAMKKNVDRLSILSGYIPAVTLTAQRAFNVAQQFFALAEKINQATPFRSTETKQQRAFMYFDFYRTNRVLFSVQTPFKLYKNMAIGSFVANQPESSKYVSDYTITFKEIRFTTSKVSSTDSLRKSQRIANVDSVYNSGVV